MGITLNRLYSEVGKTQYTTLLDYDSNNNLTYIGTASPSSSTTDSTWRIIKLVYNSNYDISSAKYAQGLSTFTNVWNDRTSYGYS
jgi:hypothetical protein